MASFHLVFIRGIGAASHACITMKALEQAVTDAGCGHVRSVLATGNFVVQSKLAPATIARHFDREMRRTGLERPLLLRPPEAVHRLLAAGIGHPAVDARPSRVLAHFFGTPATAAALDAIRSRATVETVFMLADEVVVDFSERISESALKLEWLERCIGSSGTARNWNTLNKVMQTAIAMGWRVPAASVGDAAKPAGAATGAARQQAAAK